MGLYARTNHKPIQHMEFVRSQAVRQRYWARNFVGWPRFSSVEPNAIHTSLARFQREARIQGVVTQNVDRLHTKAGSKDVIELHGLVFCGMCLLFLLLIYSFFYRKWLCCQMLILRLSY